MLAMPMALLFIGCQQDIPEPEVESPFAKNEVQDELAHTFGKLLAASLKEKPIRDFVKSEASLQFDGVTISSSLWQRTRKSKWKMVEEKCPLRRPF